MVVVRRLVHIAAILPALSLALFFLLHVMPGSPEEMILASGSEATAAYVDRVRALRGLDRPILARYGCWLIGRRESICAWWPGGQGVLRGDLGYSRVHGRPVRALLGERLARTLSLMVPAFVLGLGFALGLGVLAARHRGRAFDRVISGLGLLGLSVPLHWLALLAVLVFALGLGWFPTSGVEDVAAPGLRSQIAHAVLPILVTSVFYAGRWLRFARAAAAESLGAPFVLALRARGLSEGRVALHALRHTLVPVLTVVGHSLPAVFSGALVIERVFAYPGMGALLLESVLADDHLVAMVVLLGYAAATLLAAFLSDVAVWMLDPRLRTRGMG